MNSKIYQSKEFIKCWLGSGGGGGGGGGVGI